MFFAKNQVVLIFLHSLEQPTVRDNAYLWQQELVMFDWLAQPTTPKGIPDVTAKVQNQDIALLFQQSCWDWQAAILPEAHAEIFAVQDGLNRIEGILDGQRRRLVRTVESEMVGD